MGERRIMLLDTASLYFRAFFGVPDTFRAADGTPVNALRGLLGSSAGWSPTIPPATSSAAGTTTGGPCGVELILPTRPIEWPGPAKPW